MFPLALFLLDMLKIIMDYCSTPHDLKIAICKDPSKDDYDNLCYKLCVTMVNHKGDKANKSPFGAESILH